jgi:hypothetical protein
MRKSTSTFVLLLAGCATVATICAVPSGVAFAQDMRPPINADEVKWGPAPPNIPAAAREGSRSGHTAERLQARGIDPMRIL